jgi:hypothetical protein
MTLNPDESSKIEAEERERYRIRRRLEAFDALQGEERELAASFSEEQRAAFAEGDDVARRKIMQTVILGGLNTAERAIYDGFDEQQRTAFLALPRTERSLLLLQVERQRAADKTTAGCLVILLVGAVLGFLIQISKTDQQRQDERNEMVRRAVREIYPDGR